MAVCALGVTAASSASAASPEWFSEGAKLAAALPLTGAAVTTSTLSWNGIVVACEKASSTGAQIEGEKGGKATKLSYSACKVTSPLNCEVESLPGKVKGEITSKALSVTLEGTAAAPKYKFSPTEVNFAEFKIIGASCTQKITAVVHGTVTAVPGAKGAGPTEEALVHNIQTTAAQTEKELLVGEQKATLVGEVSLTAAKKYSEK
jgi:hypothetical protein